MVRERFLSFYFTANCLSRNRNAGNNQSLALNFTTQFAILCPSIIYSLKNNPQSLIQRVFNMISQAQS